VTDGGDTEADAGDPDSSDNGPVICPVCGADFESATLHDAGLMVNLRTSDRFERVCFQPVSAEDGAPLVRFFQHTHEEVATDEPGTAGGRIP